MENIVMLKIEQLEEHPNNPRKDLGDLTELAESIKAKGIMQNLTVVPNPNDEKYRIIIGHRRFAAAKIAWLTEVPCVITEMSEKEQMETMLLENMQRNDLTVYEQAQGFQMMMDLGETVKDIAKGTGFSKVTVKHRLKLLDLDQNKFKESVAKGGTIQDYIELEKIKDVKVKNRVLTYIGTPDFKNELLRELNRQETEKKKDKARKFFKTFAEEIEHRWAYDAPEDKELEYVRMFNLDADFGEKPGDTETEKYFFVVGFSYVELYKLVPIQDRVEEIDPKQEELKKRAKTLVERAEEIRARHRELRLGFVKKLNKISYNGFIEAVKYLCINNIYPNECFDAFDCFTEITGIEPEDEYVIDSDKLVIDYVKHNPEKALIIALVSLLEGQDYIKKIYTNGVELIEYRESSMDDEYRILKMLGYEMSEEEIQLQDGSHEIFTEAEKLAEEANAEED